ncbi:hypothetical protein TSUD_184900 [Trifolium subterraneum]|uniref:C2H2-type domain-containing protein n=1 Tax=Trifolium subterraneum TaxID=3900 RepID=A0A2Z6PHC1_TRISU|nr:hypothetical protein TSUD_184900 [Trifolium subterraneum]
MATSPPILMLCLWKAHHRFVELKDEETYHCHLCDEELNMTGSIIFHMKDEGHTKKNDYGDDDFDDNGKGKAVVDDYEKYDSAILVTKHQTEEPLKTCFVCDRAIRVDGLFCPECCINIDDHRVYSGSQISAVKTRIVEAKTAWTTKPEELENSSIDPYDDEYDEQDPYDDEYDQED